MSMDSRWTTYIGQHSMMHRPRTLSRLSGTQCIIQGPDIATLRPSVLRFKMQTLSGSFSTPTGLLQRRECSLTSRLLCSGQRAESQRRRVEASQITRKEKTQKRHQAQRKKGQEGTQERPRLAVFRSNNHIYAQVIDDTVGHTLAAVSSLTPTVRQNLASKVGANKEAAEAVGKKIAELCLSKNIEKVFLDRGGFQYHGRIEAFAQAAREGGLSF